MTELSVAVLVSVDARERYEVILPGVSAPTFSGVSLSSLLDDVTLHLMEAIPKASAKDMVAHAFDPYVELRKVKVSAELGEKKARVSWNGRLAAVVSKWKEDDFYEVIVPRLGPERLAVRRLSQLPQALAADLAARYARGQRDLDGAVCRHDEFLEILTFEVELPTVLSSQPEVRGRGMRGKRKSKRKEAHKDAEQKRTRRLVPPAELRAVGQSLSHQAIDGRLPRAFLREDLVNTVLSGLEREGAALLLVGPSGVGKSAIVAEVVRRLAQASTNLQDRREVWSVDGNRIISGMSYVGQWESRVQRMVAELSARQDVLFVEDLPSLVFAGRTSQADSHVAGYLEPHLARKELRIIGECTPERLLATRDEAPGFFARFTLVPVAPMSERQTLICLAHAVRVRAASDEVVVTPDGLQTVLGLGRRFEASSVNPGRSVRLLDRVLAERTEGTTDDLGRRVIGTERVTEHFAKRTGLPRFVLWQEQARPRGEIEAFFTRRIVAQPRAVEAAVDVVSLLEQGLADPGRPLSSFLFIGPTGVGKTETAKALAELLFGSAERLVRFDMSEFMAPHTVARLIGDRWSPEGELTRRVHQQPFSVVLLDEIEKAHPAVHDALLQVLGEGRLTNAAGQTVSFVNTVVIMTSNLGVREANRRLGFGAQDASGHQLHYRRAAERHFRPEFFNRIDRIVPFDALGQDAIVPLVQRLLEQMLSRRGLQRSSVVVDVDPELVGVLVQEGFDPRYGARSIKRILEQRLAVPLARHLVRHHADALTIAELYPRAGSIEMVLTSPLPQEPARPRRGAARTWAEGERQLARLRADLEALSVGSDAERLRTERSALLKAVDTYAEDPRTERLRTVADLFAELDRLAQALSDLEERFSVETFEEGFEVSTPNILRKPAGTVFSAGPVARPVHEVRAPFSSAHSEALDGLELDLTAARFLAEGLARGEDEAVLLALCPVGVSPGTAQTVSDLASALSGAWSEIGRLSWLTVTPFARLDGRVRAVTREDREVDEAGKSRPIPVLGLLFEGPGARALLAAEVGLHVDVVELGPDRLTQLVRVDEVGGEGAPAARLEALDAALTEYRAARRAQEVAPPLGQPRLAREYLGRVGPDPTTGWRVRLYEPSDFRMVSLLRLMGRGEGEA